MELSDLMKAAKQGAEDQLDVSKKMLTDALDASDRIHLRQNSEALSRQALELIKSDPTS